MTIAERIVKARECIVEIEALKEFRFLIRRTRFFVTAPSIAEFYPHVWADFESKEDEFMDHVIEKLNNRIRDLERTIEGLKQEE